MIKISNIFNRNLIQIILYISFILGLNNLIITVTILIRNIN